MDTFADGKPREYEDRDDADGRTGAIFTKLEKDLSAHWSAGLTFVGTDNYANDPGSTDPDVPSQGRFETRSSPKRSRSAGAPPM